jgi:hypothetical protein
VYIYFKKMFSERGVTREGASIISGKSWNVSPANIEGTLVIVNIQISVVNGGQCVVIIIPWTLDAELAW